MSLVDHLGELRTRLFRSLLAVGIGSAIGYLWSVPIRDFLIQPLPNDTGPGARSRRRIRHPDQDLDRRRDHPGDAGDPVPGLGVRRARPDDERAEDDPAVDPARAVLLRARRRDRLRRPALRGRVPPQLHRRHARPGHRRRPVLRLRDDDVPGLRPRDGVPDPAGRPVEGRHPDLGAADLRRAG